MDILHVLQSQHSKSNTIAITNYIGNDAERFAQLMRLFLEGEYRVVQRAAWVLGMCSQQHPELFMPYLHEILPYLDQPVHDAVKRNVLRVLQDMEIPNDLLGELADRCFKYLTTTEEPVAIKVFAMSVLYNICQKEPDLGQELTILIEDQMPYASAAFQSRGKKILVGLRKMRD